MEKEEEEQDEDGRWKEDKMKKENEQDGVQLEARNRVGGRKV